MSVIKESAILSVAACTALKIPEIEEKTKGLTVSEIEALSVFVRTGKSFEDCLKLSKIAKCKEMAYSIVALIE